MTRAGPESGTEASAAAAESIFDHEALPPGTRFGELEIVRVLAVGGFGIVYLARDHSLDRDLAVKEFMPSQLASRGDGLEVSLRASEHAQTYSLGLQSFVNEAKLLARFNHPSMVKVYRFWEANGTGYMAMPYLRGPTLREVRRSMTEPPTEAWMRSVIDPLLDALTMLHAEGVYHRDIAPDNVLVLSPGSPVLLDFGAARRLIGDRTRSLTTILKPSYAPIEQYGEASQLRQGPWTDLYALAAVVVYLIDGRPPPPSTARAIHDEMPVLAQRRIPEVSATFLAAIDWALAVRPQDRPQSVAELRSALEGRLVPPAAIRPHSPARETLVAPDLDEDFPITERLAPSMYSNPRRSHDPAHEAVDLDFPIFVSASHGRERAEQRGKSLLGVMASVGGALRRSARMASGPWLGAAAVLLLVGGAAALHQPKPADALAIAAPLPKVHVTGAADGRMSAQGTQEAAQSAMRKAVRATTGSYASASRRSTSERARPGPNEACADRGFFARGLCVQRLCDGPRHHTHPQCVKLRRDWEDRRRR